MKKYTSVVVAMVLALFTTACAPNTSDDIPSKVTVAGLVTSGPLSGSTLVGLAEGSKYRQFIVNGTTNKAEQLNITQVCPQSANPDEASIVVKVDGQDYLLKQSLSTGEIASSAQGSCQ